VKVKPKSNVLSMHRPSVAKDPQKKGTTFEEEEARLNVTLPVSLHQAVKVAAAQRGQTIRALIIDLLKKDGIRA
jgi:predicted DNA binding CopG/RHH family protein